MIHYQTPWIATRLTNLVRFQFQEELQGALFPAFVACVGIAEGGLVRCRIFRAPLNGAEWFEAVIVLANQVVRSILSPRKSVGLILISVSGAPFTNDDFLTAPNRAKGLNSGLHLPAVMRGAESFGNSLAFTPRLLAHRLGFAALNLFSLFSGGSLSYPGEIPMPSTGGDLFRGRGGITPVYLANRVRFDITRRRQSPSTYLSTAGATNLLPARVIAIFNDAGIGVLPASFTGPFLHISSLAREIFGWGHFDFGLPTRSTPALICPDRH